MKSRIFNLCSFVATLYYCFYGKCLICHACAALAPCPFLFCLHMSHPPFATSPIPGFSSSPLYHNSSSTMCFSTNPNQRQPLTEETTVLITVLLCLFSFCTVLCLKILIIKTNIIHQNEVWCVIILLLRCYMIIQYQIYWKIETL